MQCLFCFTTFLVSTKLLLGIMIITVSVHNVSFSHLCDVLSRNSLSRKMMGVRILSPFSLGIRLFGFPAISAKYVFSSVCPRVLLDRDPRKKIVLIAWWLIDGFHLSFRRGCVVWIVDLCCFHPVKQVLAFNPPHCLVLYVEPLATGSPSDRIACIGWSVFCPLLQHQIYL